jgi:hypothetical protein
VSTEKSGKGGKSPKQFRKPKRRNPLVPVVRGLPMRVEDSSRRYKRQAKHKKRLSPADD